MMTDPAEFQVLLEHLRSAALVSSRMPEPVFRSNYVRFHFLEFDLFGADEFWAMLQQLMKESQDRNVTLVVLDPDPEGYFYGEFGRFCAIDVPVTASAEQYRNALQSGLGLLPDTLMDNSNVLVWFPPSLQWLIWGERSPEIMVLACEHGFHGAAADILGQTGVCLLTAEDALEISSPAWPDRAARARFARQLIDNYGGAQPWTDDAADRALAFAHKLITGEIGVIEASRALASLRNEFDAPLDGLFLPFVGIASETDDLPIGSMRREWDPGALAHKDLEIARYEQAQRSLALKACRKLIESLRAPAEQ
jgi:hypothetical protein